MPNSGKKRVRSFALFGSSALDAVRHLRRSAFPFLGTSALWHLRRLRPPSAVRYSARSAMAGSTRLARLAGTYDATADTATRSIVDAAKVHGS